MQLYGRLHDIASRLGFQDLAKVDLAWVNRQEEANKRELTRLEGELRGYKNNLIRESIRMGQEDLAKHLLLTGGPLPDPGNPHSASVAGYNAAYQAFGKMREYCTTPAHVASMTLRLIYTTILQAVSASQTGSSPVLHFNSTLASANRLRSVGVKEEEMVKLTPIAQAMTGIANLGLGHYRDAAIAFLAVPHDAYATSDPVHGTDFPRAVASGNDVAIYGGLCALATMTRDELTDLVLAGPFRIFLELEPHMRKAISLYATAKYQACLATLAHYYADWSLDVFLGASAGLVMGGMAGVGSHVDRLFARIREKSITAYFSSFAEVSIASLASTFPPPTTTSSPSSPQHQQKQQEAIQNELLSLIASGALDARLDIVNGLLIAPQKETRGATHADARLAAEEVERSLLLRLHKVNVSLAGLEIPRPKAQVGGMTGWGGGDGVRVGNGGY